MLKLGIYLLFIILINAVSLNAKSFSSFEEAEKAFILHSDQDAKAYILDAGEKGHPKGQAYLAYMYIYGSQSFTKDEKKGIGLLKQSADGGVASSQITVGDMYRSGIGMSQNYSKAIEYYQMASEQNHEKALRSLANMFEFGLGVKKNLKVAYILNSISSQCQNAAINAKKNAERLSQMLSITEIADANLLLADRVKFWMLINELKK